MYVDAAPRPHGRKIHPSLSLNQLNNLSSGYQALAVANPQYWQLSIMTNNFLCIDIKGGQSVLGAQIQQYKCNDTLSQLFIVFNVTQSLVETSGWDASDGPWYQIQSAEVDLCWTVPTSMKPGMDLKLGTCSDDPGNTSEVTQLFQFWQQPAVETTLKDV